MKRKNIIVKRKIKDFLEAIELLVILFGGIFIGSGIESLMLKLGI